MDGSINIGNINEEMFLMLWCTVDGMMKKSILHSMQFCLVLRPDHGNAAGVFECLQKSLQQLAFK